MGLLIEVGQQKKLVLLVVSCCIQMMQKIPLRQKQCMSIILLLFIQPHKTCSLFSACSLYSPKTNTLVIVNT